LQNPTKKETMAQNTLEIEIETRRTICPKGDIDAILADVSMDLVKHHLLYQLPPVW
jgi:hypothetical protein